MRYTMRDRRAEDMVALGERGLRCPKEGNAARGVRHSLRGSGWWDGIVYFKL